LLDSVWGISVSGQGGPIVRVLVRRLIGDERIRFLAVGGFNTVFGYGMYALFYEVLFGHALSRIVGLYVASVLCVYAAYLVGVPLAFVLHRRLTFRVHGTGRILVDFPRFCAVYVVSLTINTFALPTIEHFQVTPLLAQAIVQVFVTVLTYFSHKGFSFRRPTSSVEEQGDTTGSTPSATEQ
jgi:putative flippase GtrA